MGETRRRSGDDAAGDDRGILLATWPTGYLIVLFKGIMKSARP
jgi:hypothetical protein